MSNNSIPIDFKIVIQVRVNSTRFPKKMLAKFYHNKTILDLIIEKLCCKFNPQQIVIATSTNPDDLIFKDVAIKYNVNFYKGAEHNVLQRFIDTAEQFNTENIIRVCADNPFLDIDLLVDMIDDINFSGIDYCSYKVDNNPAIKTHFGFFVEATTLTALKKVRKATTNKYYLEHVTNYMYENEGFKVKWLEAPIEIQQSKNIRLTVDTIEDFNLSASLYLKLMNEYNGKFNYNHILNHINKNTLLKELMEKSIIQNEK